MRFGMWTLRVNAGMVVAAGLLVVGGALYLLAPDEGPLRGVGFGVLVLSSVVYLGSRAFMMIRERDS